MPIIYDEESGGLAVASETCECGEPYYDSGCDAPGCAGYRCIDCGTGCDLDLDDTGRCATALAGESDEDYTERVNAGRAAFGLSPLAAEAGEEPQ
jgi:hypothetical protein